MTSCVSLLCNLYIPWVQSFWLFVTYNVFYPCVRWLPWGNEKTPSSFTALTIQVATKARCASVAFCILFQKPIFNDLSKARVSNTCVVYLCTEEEGFQTVCLVDQNWLRNSRERSWVIPQLPSTGRPIWFGGLFFGVVFFFFKVEITAQRKYLTVDLTLKISKLERVDRYLRILWKQIQSSGS